MAELNGAEQPEFYYSRNGEVSGPFSYTELRDRASGGRLLLTDLVWKQGSDSKVPASSVQGLFPQAASMLPAEISASGNDSVPDAGSEAGVREQANKCQHPLIRITRITDVRKRGLLSLFHGYQVTAVFQGGVVSGKSVRYPKLSETDCTEDGLTRFMETLVFRAVIPVSCIVRATLTATVRNSIVGLSIDPLVRLTITTDDRAVPLFFDRRDAGILCQRLRDLVPNGLELRIGRRFLKQEFPVEVLTQPAWLAPKAGSSVTKPLRSRFWGMTLKLLAMVILVSVIVYLPDQIHHYELDNANDRRIRDLTIGTLVAVCSIPSVVLLYVGHGLMQAGVAAAGITDQRRSILFLRSFAFDGKTTLQPNGSLAAFLGISGSGSLQAWFTEKQPGINLWYSPGFVQCVHPLRLLRLFLGIVADSTEQSIVKFFSRLGPVYAIGKPGERIASSGAHREYVGDADWQATVLSRMENCQAVILQPSQTEGMKWEIDAVFRIVPLERILLVFAGGPGMADDYENLKEHLEKSSSLRFPVSVPFRNSPIFLWFERSGAVRWSEVSYTSPASWIISGNAVDLDYTLQPFIQGIEGGEREEPRVVRSHGWFTYAVAWLIASAWLVAFGVWLVQDTHLTGFAVNYAPSPSRTIIGAAFPYQVEIPESWVPTTDTEAPLEHEFVKPGVGRIWIGAHPELDIMYYFLTESLIEKNTRANAGLLGDALLKNVVAESTTKKMLGDRECLEVRVRNEWRVVGKEFQRILAYSGSDGTFWMNVISIESPGPEQEAEILQILQSVKFTRTFNDEIRRQFREAPENVVQTVRGSSMAYTIKVPVAWRRLESSEPMVEHMFKVPKGGVLCVMAHADEEDISSIGEQILAREVAEIGDTGRVTIQHAEDVALNGQQFRRVKLSAETTDGRRVAVNCLAHSSRYGTVLLKGIITETKDGIEEQVLLEEVEASIRIADSFDGTSSSGRGLRDSSPH